MSASSAASSAAASTTAASTSGAAAAPAADPAASLLTQAAEGLSTSASSVVDGAMDVVVPQLTSLYGALDPDSSWHTAPRLAQLALDWVHTSTGLPWWACIAVLTFGARLALSPLSVMQHKATTGLARATPHLKELKEHHSQVADAYGGAPLPLKVTMEQAAEIEAMTNKYGAKNAMLKTFGPALCSAPIFISFFVGLRAFAHVDPTFCTGGMAWFSNLAELDPYGLLSVVNGCMIAGTVYLNSEGVQRQGEMSNIMRKVMYGFAFLSVPLTAKMIPAGVLVYWITSSVTLMAQGQLLRAKPVRGLLGIPDMPPPAPNAFNAPPAKHVEELKIKWNQDRRNAAAAAAAAAAQGASAAPAQAQDQSVPINPFSRATMNMDRTTQMQMREAREAAEAAAAEPAKNPLAASSASATYTPPPPPPAGKQKRKPQKSIAGNNNANTNRKR